jgi:hypothetical protein
MPRWGLRGPITDHYASISDTPLFVVKFKKCMDKIVSLYYNFQLGFSQILRSKLSLHRKWGEACATDCWCHSMTSTLRGEMCYLFIYLFFWNIIFSHTLKKFLVSEGPVSSLQDSTLNQFNQVPTFKYFSLMSSFILSSPSAPVSVTWPQSIMLILYCKFVPYTYLSTKLCRRILMEVQFHAFHTSVMDA